MRHFRLKSIYGKSGFTIVELIVALSLFTVVMMISTGAIVSLADTNKKVQSMRIAMDNLSLALESMSREIRMGTSYYCDPAFVVDFKSTPQSNDCTAGASIAFLAQDGITTMVYDLSGNAIRRSKDGGSNFSEITAQEVNISSLNFYVIGSAVGGDQARVVIVVKGIAGSLVTSSFNLQTTVTGRVPG